MMKRVLAAIAILMSFSGMASTASAVSDVKILKSTKMNCVFRKAFFNHYYQDLIVEKDGSRMEVRKFHVDDLAMGRRHTTKAVSMADVHGGKHLSVIGKDGSARLVLKLTYAGKGPEGASASMTAYRAEWVSKANKPSGDCYIETRGK